MTSSSILFNIKRSITIIIVAFIFGMIFSVSALGQESTKAGVKKTPSATPTDAASERLEKIKALKERVATKVAELKKQQKIVVGGVVKTIETDSLVLQSGEKQYTILFSSDTKIASLSAGKKTTIKVGDLKIDDTIAVLADRSVKENTYNGLSIIKNVSPWYRLGKISGTDVPNGSFEIVSSGETRTVDVEVTTKGWRYDTSEKKLVKVGLSKLHIGDTVFLIASPDPKNADRVQALRFIVMRTADISPTPQSSLVSPTSMPTVRAKSETPTPTAKAKPALTIVPTKTP